MALPACAWHSLLLLLVHGACRSPSLSPAPIVLTRFCYSSAQVTITSDSAKLLSKLQRKEARKDKGRKGLGE